MNLDYCKELIVLADLLSFRKAAEQLFITQSTLSKHVAAVEKEAGFRIFDRSTSHVALTEGGKVYIEYLREVIIKYDMAVFHGKSRQDSSVPQIRLIGPLLNDAILAPILAACTRLKESGHKIQTLMSDIGVRDAHDRIRNNLADIAISFRYSNQEDDLFAQDLFDIPFGILCKKTHRLAQKEYLSFEDIVGEELISYPFKDRESYHNYVDQVCLKHGIPLCRHYTEDNYFPFFDDENTVLFGVYYPGYSKYGDTYCSRALDDRSDVFTIEVIRRVLEDRPAVCDFFDAIVTYSGASE